MQQAQLVLLHLPLTLPGRGRAVHQAWAAAITLQQCMSWYSSALSPSVVLRVVPGVNTSTRSMLLCWDCTVAIEQWVMYLNLPS